MIKKIIIKNTDSYNEYIRCIKIPLRRDTPAIFINVSVNQYWPINELMIPNNNPVNIILVLLNSAKYIIGSRKNQWRKYKSKFKYGTEYNMADKIISNVLKLNILFAFINII